MVVIQQSVHVTQNFRWFYQGRVMKQRLRPLLPREIAQKIRKNRQLETFKSRAKRGRKKSTIQLISCHLYMMQSLCDKRRWFKDSAHWTANFGGVFAPSGIKVSWLSIVSQTNSGWLFWHLLSFSSRCIDSITSVSNWPLMTSGHSIGTDHLLRPRSQQVMQQTNFVCQNVNRPRRWRNEMTSILNQSVHTQWLEYLKIKLKSPCT